MKMLTHEMFLWGDFYFNFMERVSRVSQTLSYSFTKTNKHRDR